MFKNEDDGFNKVNEIILSGWYHRLDKAIFNLNIIETILKIR